MTTHIHDNRRQRDDHLVPFDAHHWAADDHRTREDRLRWRVDVQVRNVDSPQVVLARAVDARRRLEDSSATSSQLIADN